MSLLPAYMFLSLILFSENVSFPPLFGVNRNNNKDQCLPEILRSVRPVAATPTILVLKSVRLMCKTVDDEEKYS